jgi:hypothetical protein
VVLNSPNVAIETAAPRIESGKLPFSLRPLGFLPFLRNRHGFDSKEKIETSRAIRCGVTPNAAWISNRRMEQKGGGSHIHKDREAVDVKVGHWTGQILGAGSGPFYWSN